MSNRDAWASRIGLVLAMAGNAVGLGNFLRFPRQAALNGGGAFMIPYFVALLAMGIPLMWLEWTMGRYGGSFGQSTPAGMFDRMWKSKWAKYLGSLGISIPLLFAVYYLAIESWTLAYTWFSVSETYFGKSDLGEMHTFLQSYQGVSGSPDLAGLLPALGFWIGTLALNMWVLHRGISAGIEKLAKIAMPLLIIFAVVLVVRVLFVGTPDPAQPENSVANGFGYVWNPDVSRLADFGIWLAAAGQIFFTLSVGSGAIHAYAAYVKRRDDIALTGLTTSATNTFVEVLLGGSIAIPIAVAFLGLAATQSIAQGGSFDLGFVAMPIIFQKIPLGAVFGALWFALLFFAGITSSIALLTPFMALLKENLGLSRNMATAVTSTVLFVLGLPVVVFLKYGYMDQYDFWIGTFLLVVFALAETLVFVFAFSRPVRDAAGEKGKGLVGMLRYGLVAGWEEMQIGADMKIPRIFYYCIKYIMPIFLVVLLVGWTWQDLTSKESIILMHGVEGETALWRWVARATILGVVVVAMPLLVRLAWKRSRS